MVRVEVWVMQKTTGAIQMTFQETFPAISAYLDCGQSVVAKTAGAPPWSGGLFKPGVASGIAVAIGVIGNVQSYYWWSEEVELISDSSLFRAQGVKFEGQHMPISGFRDPRDDVLVEVMELTGKRKVSLPLVGKRDRQIIIASRDKEFKKYYYNVVFYHEPMEVWYGGPGIRVIDKDIELWAEIPAPE